MNILVHVRTASATTAMGKKMQLTTINLVPWYSGLTKLDVLPGGGGMAGVISAMVAFFCVLCTVQSGESSHSTLCSG